jgi:hypothetical protein
MVNWGDDDSGSGDSSGGVVMAVVCMIENC